MAAKKPKIEFNTMTAVELRAMQKQLTTQLKSMEDEESRTRKLAQAEEARLKKIAEAEYATKLETRQREALDRIAILDASICDQVREIENIMDQFAVNERPYYCLEVGDTSFERVAGYWKNSYQ